MRHRVVAGTRRPRATVSDRRRTLRSSLTAAAAPMLATYDMTHGTPAERHFYEQALAAGLTEFAGEQWPCEVSALDGTGAEFHDGSHCAIWRLDDGTLAYASLHGGWFRVTTASKDLGAAYAACFAFRDPYPASYLTNVDDPRVAITFWSMGPFGPQSRLRRIEASPWEPIAENYTAAVRAELDAVMAWHDGPEADGQLMLWQGPPGTGKTWALRALASEWAPWAEFHYITDPDSFFVDNPSYMIDVLLADSYDVMEADTGDIYQEADPEGKWRVLILEDTGELLSVNAKEKYGQGLSRLLNVVDGMIGQGLRVLCLVTTNDELGELTPAVKRPGRCASQLVFDAFEPEEASAWLGETVDEPLTVAEMYARRGDHADALDIETLGSDEETAAALAAAATSTREEIARVAAEHQPGEPAYGQTAWNPEEGVVFWVSWDGTSNEEAEAIAEAMLAIGGIDAFEYEAEALPDGWWDAEVVYPDDPPLWVLERQEEAALADVLALAAQPLESVAATAAPAPTRRESVLAAVEALVASSPITQLVAAHERVVDGVKELLAGDAVVQEVERSHALAASAINALHASAAREMPTPHVEVNVPPTHVTVEGSTFEPQIDVHVPERQITVNVPEQAPPVVQVAAAEPSPVHVTVEAAPAPDVHVEVQPASIVAAAPPRAVRVATDPVTGDRWFIPEGAEDAEQG